MPHISCFSLLSITKLFIQFRLTMRIIVEVSFNNFIYIHIILYTELQLHIFI
jgi:hypothetical protein